MEPPEARDGHIFYFAQRALDAISDAYTLPNSEQYPEPRPFAGTAKYPLLTTRHPNAVRISQ